MVNGFWRDLALAARALINARAFTFVCVVSLGVGMAPVIAIPYASRLSHVAPAGVMTDGLVELVTTANGPHAATNLWSYPDFVDLRDSDTGIELIGWAGAQSEITFATPGATKTRVSTIFVSPSYFKTMGVTLARGAGFDATNRALTAEPVVVVGYRFWQNRLGSDPDVVGKTLTLDGVPHLVAGVAPDQFGGHLGFQGGTLFAPLERHPDLRGGSNAERNLRDERGRAWLRIHGRLAPAVSVGQASAAVATVTARLAKEHPATNEFRAGVAKPYDPLGTLERSEFRVFRAVAFTLTGMVLLVVSLNISGMMQVRGALRERELSIRQAIGASRARLAQLLMSEAAVIACAGGTFASLVLLNIPALVAWLADTPIPPQVQQALRIDLPVIASTFGSCLLTSVVLGWLPALRFSRPAIISSLKDDAGAGGSQVGRVHRVTAALQVAIAVPLLVMSGQGLDRVRATAAAPLGFDADRVYAAPLKLDGLDVDNAGFQIRRLSEMLAQVGGVDSVTVADGLPLDFRYRLEKVALDVEAGVAPRSTSAHVTRVGDGYLEALGIPLLSGRGFTADDRAGAEPVTVISKPLADKLAPNDEVVGKRLRSGGDPATQQTLTIIGVTADFPTSQMNTWREQLLLPLAQHPGVSRDSVTVTDDVSSVPRVLLIARSAVGAEPKMLTTALENVARQLDPDLTATAIVTGSWLRRNSVNDFMTQSAVAGGAGGVILMLAALGVYGVVGLMVAARTREIAVRTALGASRRRVLRMIVFDVVKLVLPGVVVGVILTVVLNRLNAENMGIALSGMEPLAYVVGAAVAVLVAIVASLVPARRAASVPPMVAMRST
ncbi:MAG TPA: ABC transporter permease [Vicinamibacterales bacterium]|nr:ABC transporter permease [Vicinamibacterales bacterium]